MKNRTGKIRQQDIAEFREYLLERENSGATIEKYVRDVRKFYTFSKDGVIAKEKLLLYKEWLMEHYTASSVNSMLVALNQFLVFMELGSLRLKRLRVQQSGMAYMDKALDKKEFRLLVKTARDQGKCQLAMMMETMCATGIRVSELKYFQVQNVKDGLVKVWNKGKYRYVILPDMLRKKLLLYIRKNQITSGIIFCTRSGREKNRSNIWREMKALSEKTGVNARKIFPHNLRHLFARTFYSVTRNLINLADILGHSNIEVTRIYASQGINEWKQNIEKVKLLESIT